MTITKTFTQMYVATDCEARHWEWKDTDNTYEALAEELRTEWDGWFDAVRIVEKIFDSETFTITVKVIKTTERAYKDLHWDKAIGAVETIAEA